ncbi:MAG TPA: HAD-IIIA family hydrolase [Candidatus Nanoarchaeia archaeon]|nr:HAD-IIIA family hydrolase [Candidatus Nanoarchaeia archaeon]
MQKYAFVDRDGTFLWEPKRPEDVDPRETFPLKNMDEFHFMDGAIEGLKALTDKGYELVMVTNQTFLGTSKHPQEMFNAVMQRIYDELGAHDISFAFVMVCPHGPDEGCGCRKPKIGGLNGFLEKNKGNIDFAHSLMFGDRDTDGQFARNLGVKFVRIETNRHFSVPEWV